MRWLLNPIMVTCDQRQRAEAIRAMSPAAVPVRKPHPGAGKLRRNISFQVASMARSLCLLPLVYILHRSDPSE